MLLNPRTHSHASHNPTPPHFHKKTWHQLDLGGIFAYPWMCHEVEILSSTCAGKTVRASGGLPSHPLSLHPSARWTARLTHSKAQAKGFCYWIYSSFNKLSSFFNITRKGIGYVTHISTCCFIHCQLKASCGKTGLLISHSGNAVAQVRAENIAQKHECNWWLHGCCICPGNN